MIDIESILVSLRLGLMTAAALMVVAPPLAAWLVSRRSVVGRLGQGVSLLPLAVPPTVLGLVLVVGLGSGGPVGRTLEQIGIEAPLFTLTGIWLASCLTSLPLALQPMLVAFRGIDRDIVSATTVCGATGPQAFWHVQVPLAVPGIVTGGALAFAHSVGEFGVILMVGGNIPGVTRTASVAIYDDVQAFEMGRAWATAGLVVAMTGVLVIGALLLGAAAENGKEGRA